MGNESSMSYKSRKKAYSYLMRIVRNLHLYPWRPMMRYIKQHYQQPLVGVEIGVSEGMHANNILSTLSIKKLYLVDPYTNYSEYNNDSVDFEKIYKNAQKRLLRFNNKIQFIRDFSEDAANQIPDNHLDFVYIDACHRYEYVKKDIELYYPKVKKGGVIGGHNFEIRFKDVCKVVLKFADKHNLELQGEGIDWWIIKNVVG